VAAGARRGPAEEGRDHVKGGALWGRLMMARQRPNDARGPEPTAAQPRSLGKGRHGQPDPATGRSSRWTREGQAAVNRERR
jgi:hypothetical protein